MKTKLLGTAFVLIAAGLVTGQVMSQQPVAESPALGEPTPVGKISAPQAAQNDDKVESKIQELDAELGEAAAPSQAELRAALKRYLARKRLDRILADLEDVVKQAPGTIEATQAAAAIQALSVAPQAPRRASDEDFGVPPRTSNQGFTPIPTYRPQPTRGGFAVPVKPAPGS